MVACRLGAGVVEQEGGITREDKQTVGGNRYVQGLECGHGAQRFTYISKLTKFLL